MQMKSTILIFTLLFASGLALISIPPSSALPCLNGCFQGANCCATGGPFDGNGYAGVQDSKGAWHCPGAPLGQCLDVVCDSPGSCSWAPRNELCDGCGTCQVEEDALGNPVGSSCVPSSGCEIPGDGKTGCLNVGQSRDSICCTEGNKKALRYAKCFSEGLQDPGHPEWCYFGSQQDICDAASGWTCRNSPVDTTPPTDCSFSENGVNYYGCTGKRCTSTGLSCGDPVTSETVDLSSCKQCSTSACSPGTSYASASEGCWSAEFSGCCIGDQVWSAETSTDIDTLFMSQICLNGYYQIRSQAPVTYYLLDVVIAE